MSDQPPPPPPPPDARAGGGDGSDHPSGLSADARNWAVLAHLSAFAGAFFVIALVGPLVVYLLKRDEHPFVEHHAREALNFNITFLIALVVTALSILILVGLVLLPVVAIGWIVLTIVAAVKASNGEDYTYPLTIRFIN